MTVSPPTSDRPEPEKFDPGSFRDPAGRVLVRDGRVFRLVFAPAAEDVEWLFSQGLIARLIQDGSIVNTRRIAPESEHLHAPGVEHVLEHEPLRFWSYPYEWPFSALKAAALFHLDLHRRVLAEDATLIDASAYNVQFVGPRPLFIDVLSLRRYRTGELWAGHRQFCQQFLNPLLLQAKRGIPFNAWYRGSMEGIPPEDIAPLLGRRSLLSWQTLAHVHAQARLQHAAEANQVQIDRARERRLSKRALDATLAALARWIKRLEPKRTSHIGWTTYAAANTYSAAEAETKRRFIAEFASAVRPALMADVGCNTGDYSACALGAGASYVIGLEGDPATADKAFRRAQQDGLNLLPLVVDAADPSPARGWRGGERRSLQDRARFDALIALAFEHHLAIGRNIPLDDVVDWLTGMAPTGVIEFVPKSDPTIQRMLALRGDIFDAYDRNAFVNALSARARLVRTEVVSTSGRELFWYETAL